MVQQVLQASGAEVSVHKVLVDSEATARKLRFISSPTIRVNGRDIALELRETACDSCAGACGCDSSIACRVWLYEGKEYNEAPVPLLINALLAEVYGCQSASEPLSSRSFALRENLKQFFVAKAAKKPPDSCCSAEEKASLL